MVSFILFIVQLRCSAVFKEKGARIKRDIKKRHGMASCPFFEHVITLLSL